MGNNTKKNRHTLSVYELCTHISSRSPISPTTLTTLSMLNINLYKLY